MSNIFTIENYEDGRKALSSVEDASNTEDIGTIVETGRKRRPIVNEDYIYSSGDSMDMLPLPPTLLLLETIIPESGDGKHILLTAF
jgi:hypothetical protein